MLVVVRNRQSVVLSPTSGPVAQLGARFHGMEEVVGSIPTRSTKDSTAHHALLCEGGLSHNPQGL